jgi:hypothetical protein
MNNSWKIALSLAATLAITLASGSRAVDDANPAGPLSSHKQTKIISIPIGEEKVKIHTFCVDPKGRLLCSCGGEQMVTKRTPEGFKAEVIKSSPGIRVVSPEGELLAEWPVDFTPQTVNVGPDGFVYCGGAGKIAKLTMDGKIVKLIDAPNTKEMPPLPDVPNEIKMSDAEVNEREERKQKLTEQVAAIREEMTDLRTKLMKDDQPKIDQLAKEYQEKSQKAAARDIDPEEANRLRAEAIKARTEMFKLMMQVQSSAEYQKVMETYREAYMRLRDVSMDPMQAALRQRNAALRSRRISGIAINEKDVFICCQPPKGYGFQVWRGDQNLENFKMIVPSLRGCCGNMDIQAHGDKLYAAENARKKVVVFDRDGKKLASWGGSGRDGIGENFGSCCNPMNIRFDHEGNVLTSESNVGVIKRFTPEGKFLGRVGRVEIIPGCKHVAIGVADNGEKIYMLDITRSHIVLMEPVKDNAKVATK